MIGYTTESITQRFNIHESRLGDELDDFCIKCKRLTNHAIVSLLDTKAAKVRCKTCYHDHDFRNGEPLPSKKELKKAALLEQGLTEAGTPIVVPVDGIVVESPPQQVETPVPVDAEAVPVKKGKKTAKS